MYTEKDPTDQIKSGPTAVNSGKMRKNFAGAVIDIHILDWGEILEDKAGQMAENWIELNREVDPVV